MHAYDLSILHLSAEAEGDRYHGWCFGLPPGIAREQWPLDPRTGFPLMHGFTLLLPDDYRVHGPDIVALSFFATAPDHFEGAGQSDIARVFELMETALMETAEEPSEASGLLPFWRSVRRPHPRLHRLKDDLWLPYALILLDRQEFHGSFCTPPDVLGNPHLAGLRAPRWLADGSARAYWDGVYSPALGLPVERYGLYRILGQVPDKGVAFNRAIRWTPRAHDPNAGRAPRPPRSAAEAGYEPAFYAEIDASGAKSYRLQDWAKDHAPNHIGGTMCPVQGVRDRPAFSPFYVEFEEYFGGCNFGSGNAQLDFRDMLFDWSC